MKTPMIPHEAIEKLADIYAESEDTGSLETARTALEEVSWMFYKQAWAVVAPLISSLTDPDECWFDHHGGCQAHGYLSLQPGQTCPQQDAKEFVRTVTAMVEE